MDLDEMEWPDEARAIPTGRPGTLLFRFPNEYGASVIRRPSGGDGVEIAVIGFTDPAAEEWVFEHHTGVTSPGNAILGNVISQEEADRYFTEIAALDRRRLEYGHEGVCFRWVSRAYIDVFWPEDLDEGAPFACINVYDYAAGACEINTREDFEAKCRAWVTDLEEGELANYAAHTR